MKVKRTELKNYTDLLSLSDMKGRTLKHVLVSGLGGMGKTTMISRIAYKWASDSMQHWYDWGIFSMFQSNPLKTFEHVFLIDLRKIEANMDILDVIRSQLLGNVSRHILEEYLTMNADKCLYLFDGYDELRGGDKVLNSTLLCGSHVIVTSRPNKIDRFYQSHGDYVQVQIQGFSWEGCVKFIDTFFQDDNETKNASDLVSEIKRSQMIKSMIHFPLLLGMICFIWKGASSLPTTVSQLFKLVTEYLVKHWKARETCFASLSYEEFKEHVGFEKIMVEIGKTALHGLISDSKLIFKENEFGSREVVEKGCSLGILSSESKISGLDQITYVSFIHKTFQEYCAALYLSNLAESNVNEMKSHLSGMNFDHMENVLKFCCGVSERAAEVVITYIADLSQDDTTGTTHYETTASDSRDSCRLPFIFLFEAESSFGVKSTLQTIFRSAVSSITMYVSTGYDPDYFAALSYIVNNFETQHEWNTCIRMVTIPAIKVYHYSCDYETNSSRSFQGPLISRLGQKQLEFLNKLQNIKRLAIVDRDNGFLAIMILITHMNQMIHSAEELILTGDIDIRVIYDLLIPILRTTKVRFHVNCIRIKDKTNLHLCSYVLRTIKIMCGSASLKVTNFDLSETDAIFEGIVIAGNMLYTRDASNSMESVPLEELILTRMLSESYWFGDYHSNLRAKAVSTLCAATVFLGNLQTLKLHDCQLLDDTFQELGPTFRNLIQLQNLDLSCNTIGRSLEAVIRGINHSRIKNLDLHCTKLTKESRSALSLLRLSFLERLDLSNNCIESNDSKALGLLLLHAPNLKLLDLSDNVLECHGMEELRENFKKKYLCVLKMRKNRIGSDGAIALASSLQYTTDLQCLELSLNQIQDEGTKELAAVLTHTSMVTLTLADNQIQCEGASVLALALKHTPYLQTLDLSHNQIQCKGAKAIASALQHISGLSKLDLSNNQIQCEGAIAIAPALHTTDIRTLDLSNNKIQCVGAKAIASVLRDIPNLSHLNLSGNQIQSDGARALGSSLQHTTELYSLDLANNPIQADGIEAIREFVALLPRSFSVQFDRNIFSGVQRPRTLWRCDKRT